jgi:hypothetical protein
MYTGYSSVDTTLGDGYDLEANTHIPPVIPVALIESREKEANVLLRSLALD